jgi:hypothetical protein
MEGASPSDLRAANQRFGAVMTILAPGTAGQSDIPKRTLSRWLKQFREAELKYGCGYVGRLPRTQARGNRTAKAPTAASELLNTSITEQFETPTQAPAASVYRAYQRACERMALDAVEGEQKLGYSESRRDHLWRLLQSGMTSTTVPTLVVSTTVVVEDVPPLAKKPRENRSAPLNTESVTASVEISVEPVPPKKRRSKKAVATPELVPETLNVINDLAVDPLGTETPLPVSEPAKKKTSRRVGQRNPHRDPVG